ncbi:nucleotidyl transferase AbiEii/AbiGii toxin family protein [Formosa haliotis]|uniref:nucleotidyl transferase AbiEii/AbiGii toxin family protein n=1 Tax=Formosa haliotis TaxID=1555194 RepID=UPI001F46B9ED|nr:nucleotidyl transferase AbiEii/AbiGii toxin family protein [Formosa haliotis]
MAAKEFENFRLVGGTALSLQIGHRESIDIDLFSDAPYDSIDFDNIEAFLKNTFPYLDHLENIPVGMGKSYFVGKDSINSIKLDLFYTDKFIKPPVMVDTIRMASLEEVIAMKLDVIQRGGRKKDFWDLHELFKSFDLAKMLELHEQRYPYDHDRFLILKNFIDFSQADDDFDPICNYGKYWEFIKDDITTRINNYTENNIN